MRNVSEKTVDEIKNILYSITFFFRKSCRLWCNVEKYCRAGQVTYDNITQAHCSWKPQATNVHSECVMLIAFLLQQWLQVRASMLRY